MLYEQSRDYSAIRLDRVKEEEEKEEENIIAGASCQRRGVEGEILRVRCRRRDVKGEVSRARMSKARYQYGSVELRAFIEIEKGL
jgi:hypothetical protein